MIFLINFVKCIEQLTQENPDFTGKLIIDINTGIRMELVLDHVHSVLQLNDVRLDDLDVLLFRNTDLLVLLQQLLEFLLSIHLLLQGNLQQLSLLVRGKAARHLASFASGASVYSRIVSHLFLLYFCVLISIGNWKIGKYSISNP